MMRTGRTMREPLKKPRPLKTVNSTDSIKSPLQEPKETVIQKNIEEIIDDLEILNVSISNCNFDEITVADISRMCGILKNRGKELDSFNRDAMDRFFSTLRNASREERLDVVSRLKLLTVIELRARHWKKTTENLNNYYSMKIAELEQGLDVHSLPSATSPTIYPLNQNLAQSVPSVPLAHGEVLRSSGKFAKPMKIAGKNYFKDEIVIRNSDSGKVNPGARDRLVQITGAHEESISHAKMLVEDTIRRNASPVRDTPADILEEVPSEYQPVPKRGLQHSCSVGDASLKEMSVPLQVGSDFITLSGTNPELLKMAKSVLQKYFTGQLEAAFEKV